MSKKMKKSKQKTTAFDIVYRVVTALIGIAIFPLVYLLKMVYIQVNHLNLLDGGKVSTNATYLELGLSDIIDGDFSWFFDAITKGNDGYFSRLFELELYRPVIIAAIFFIIALLIVLAIILVAIISNKAKPVVFLSIAGLVSTGISYFCFNSLFVSTVVGGEYTLAQLLNTSDYFINLLLGFVGNITNIHLCEAFSAVFFGLVAILVWALSVHIVNYGEDKEAQKAAEAKKVAKNAKKAAKEAKDAKKAAKEAEEVAKEAEKAAKEAKKAAKDAKKAVKEVEETTDAE